MNRKEEIVNEITMLKKKIKVLKKELYDLDDNTYTNFIDDRWANPPYKKHPDYIKWDRERQKYGDDKNMPMDLMYYEYPDLYIEWYKSVSGKLPDKIYDKKLKCDVPHPPTISHISHTKTKNKAMMLRDAYFSGYEFPDWVIGPLWDSYNWRDSVVFYHKTDDIEIVKKLATQREPCNIAGDRLFHKDKMKTHFGWSRGAYYEGAPNIAVYCNSVVKTAQNKFINNVKVINLIGCALDSHHQPDYKYYKDLASVQTFYANMWRLGLAAAIHSRCKKFKIFNVGGGAFAGNYFEVFIKDIFEKAFKPLLPEFKKAGISILGYDFKTKKFNGGFIPDIFDNEDEDVQNTLYVNAWDPWSIIGNGNGSDKSLDGFWGRCSNMSVLGWSITNPHMGYIAV
jgi:hypothetical protein